MAWDWGVMVPAVATAAVGLSAGWWSRKTASANTEVAKQAAATESEHQAERDAAALYSTLTSGQQGELVRLYQRLSAVEDEAARSRGEVGKIRAANRVHHAFDLSLLRQLRDEFPDRVFPDAPPLDL